MTRSPVGKKNSPWLTAWSWSPSWGGMAVATLPAVAAEVWSSLYFREPGIWQKQEADLRKGQPMIPKVCSHPSDTFPPTKPQLLTSSQPSQLTVTPSGNQMSKHISLWGIFDIQTIAAASIGCSRVSMLPLHNNTQKVHHGDFFWNQSPFNMHGELTPAPPYISINLVFHKNAQYLRRTYVQPPVLYK